MIARLSRPLLLAALATASLAQRLPAQAPSPQLSAVFTQMDAASKRFGNATADVERDNYERVVHETTVEKGTLFIDRSHGAIEFGATVAEVGPDGKPLGSPARVISYTGGTLQMYTPAEKQVDVFKAGANGSQLEGYFALGFGGTSGALTSAWTVTDAGPETLTDNGHPVKTEKLVLVSKDPGVRNTFKQITLWLDPSRDVSLKQVFETPSGDRQTAIYSNIRTNTKANRSPYRIPSGKGITVINH